MVSVGDMAPDFELMAFDKTMVRLSDSTKFSGDAERKLFGEGMTALDALKPTTAAPA